VEDNEEDAFFILRAFQALGLPLTVQRCHNGQEAIDYLDPGSISVERHVFKVPQLVILDLKMPGKDGFDVLEWIQQHNLSVVVVILTSSASEKEMQRIAQYPVHAYWIKPSSLKDMEEVVRCICHLWLHHVPGPVQKKIFDLTG